MDQLACRTAQFVLDGIPLSGLVDARIFFRCRTNQGMIFSHGSIIPKCPRPNLPFTQSTLYMRFGAYAVIHPLYGDRVWVQFARRRLTLDSTFSVLSLGS